MSFDHVTIRASDRQVSERFYATVLGALGYRRWDPSERFAFWGRFAVAQAGDGHPVTRGLHVGFLAASREDVDAFWRAGVDAGFRDDGPPGPRPQYREDYYGGFLLDPDGNSAEAVHHGAPRPRLDVDHLWLRVADLAASRRFYARVAPHTGFALDADTAERVSFSSAAASFSLVPGDARTEHVHIAFPAPGPNAVDAFHRTAVEAGYRDNGAPGARPEYHPGYYGAFVLDPDGHNVEVVDHQHR